MSSEIRIDGIIGTGPGEISSQWVRSQLPTDGSQVVVKIHSEGGSVFEGFAIYDALNAYTGPKTAIIESSAFSIASFIPMACDQVEITPNGYMMLHNPWMEAEGDDEQLSKHAALLGQLKSNMVAAYSKRTGKSPDEILGILKAETYYNAQDAVASGLVNRITEKPITGRVFARLDRMPHGVVSALFGAGSDGNQDSLQKEKPMSDSTPVAATIEEIESAFPKMKPGTILACLKAKKPMASVAQAAVEEMMAENSNLMAQVKAMEEELAGYKAKGMSDEEELVVPDAKAEEMDEEIPAEEMAKARRSGARPVAVAVASGKSAADKWNGAIEVCLPKCGGNKQKAVAMANRKNPGLRQAYINEVNS